MNEKNFFTVSELNGHIKDVLNMGFPAGVWVCGEIQGYDRNRDKSHVFFELCEKDPISKDILARIGLVMFSGRKPYIREVLKNSQAGFDLKDDIEVKFLCRVDFYPPHGAVRLIVESIDPIYTLGKIALEKQKLIEKLKKKGTLDKNKQLELSSVPLKIGLITSYDSAAYNDFVSELKMSGYGFQIFCRNTIMQGKTTPEDVCRAMDELCALPELDVIVISRGGGSIADLSCFDSELIAEKIAACALPVLSGIGHEINLTITDLASHTHQKTPTAIARFLVEKVNDFLAVIEEKVAKILESSAESLTDRRTHLLQLAQRFREITGLFLKDHHRDVVERQEALRQVCAKYFHSLKRHDQIQQESLERNIKGRLTAEQVRLKNFNRLLELALPEKTLKRGFSITRTAEGKLLRSVAQLKSHDALEVELLDGKVKSTVTGILKEK